MDPFNEIFKRLCDKLKNDCVLEETSQHFAFLKSNYDRFKFSFTLLEDADILPSLEFSCNKNSLKSGKLRNDGNHLFMKRKDMDALEFYSRSVAFAPINSEELSLGYANRSAVSFSLKQYEDCIIDIDRALSGKYPEHLKFKLYERQGKCFIYLKRNDLARESYTKALDLVCKSKLLDDKIACFQNCLKEELKNLVVDGNFSDCVIKKQYSVPRLSYPQSDEIVSACCAIKINYNKEMGRHIVTTKTVNPGDVLVVEQPYASVLLPSSYNLYCFNCLKRCHVLLPCLKCSNVLFCSVECRSNCFKNNHWIECTVLPELINLGCNKLELLAVRTLLVASRCDKLKSLKEYVNIIDKHNNNLVDERLKGFDENGKYRSDHYQSVHYLATNTKLRTNADLFRRACFAGCIIHCIDKLSNYFVVNTDDNHEHNVAMMSGNDCENFDYKCFAGSLLLRYLQVMPCNAHEVSEMCVTKYLSVKYNNEGDGDFVDKKSFIYDSREIGGALYPVLSLINHSCDPNVVRHSHNGDTVVLTAIQRIPLGEQILDNYGYHHAVHDLQTRQNHLFLQYHFNCKCIACCEDWPRYHLLPDKHIVYKAPELEVLVEKSSKDFRMILEQVLKGNFNYEYDTTNDDGSISSSSSSSNNIILDKLVKHLCLLEDAVKRPWKEYSECQEAIKQTLSMYANHYVISL